MVAAVPRMATRDRNVQLQHEERGRAVAGVKDGGRVLIRQSYQVFDVVGECCFACSQGGRWQGEEAALNT